MAVQEIESTSINEVLEYAKGVAVLGLPFELKAVVQTKVQSNGQYRSLLYTLRIEAAPRGTVSNYTSSCWLVKE